MTIALDKKADLAGPGIGNYDEIEKILPADYKSLLDPKETQIALAVPSDLPGASRRCPGSLSECPGTLAKLPGISRQSPRTLP